MDNFIENASTSFNSKGWQLLLESIHIMIAWLINVNQFTGDNL